MPVTARSTRARGNQRGKSGNGARKRVPGSKIHLRMRMACRSGLLWRRAPRRITRRCQPRLTSSPPGICRRIVAEAQAASLTMRQNPAVRLLFRPKRTDNADMIKTSAVSASWWKTPFYTSGNDAGLRSETRKRLQPSRMFKSGALPCG